MADFTRPQVVVPDKIDPKDLPHLLRLIQEWMASQVSASERRILQDPRFSNERVAHSLRAMQQNVSLDQAKAPVAGMILYAKDPYHADWGDFTGGGTGPGPTTPFVQAQYVVMALDAGLTSERRLQVEASVLGLADGGANGDATISVATNGISDAKLRQGVATSVIGRSANSTGNVADIAASAAHQVLRRNASNALEFGLRTDSLIITNNEWRSCGAVACLQQQAGTSPDLYDYWEFTSVSDSDVSATVIVPTDWGSGNITAKVKWATAGAVAATTWAPEIRYLSAADGADLTGAGTTINAGATNTNIAANLIQTTTVGTITPGAAGRTLRLVMRRLLGDANDNYTGSIRFVEMVLEYQPIH